jgi:hypothetical protein
VTTARTASATQRAGRGVTSAWANVAAFVARPAGRRLLLVLGILAYAGIWAFSGSFHLNDTDFDVFFLPSARIALAGHPLHIYQVRYQVVYPDANGPLTIAPMTAVAWVEQQLGWLDNHELRRLLMMAAFAVFPLLVGREALLALDRLLKVPLRGLWRFAALAAFIGTPELWHSALLYGHLEQPIMLWLLLASVRMLAEGKPARGGLLMGLALLARTSALLYLLALGLTLLLRGRWRESLRFGAVAVLTTAAGLLPFFLADAKDTLYSLVTFREQLVVGGGTIWGAITNNPGVTEFALHHDSLVVVGASLVLILATLLLRRDLDVGSRDIYLLLAVADLCFPLFIKTIWPYYFLETYVLVALWWLAGADAVITARGRTRWLLTGIAPLATIGLAQLAEYVLSSPGFVTWSPEWSARVFAATLLFTAAAAIRLWAPRRRRPLAIPGAV